MQMEVLTTLIGEYGLDAEEFPPALIAAAMQGLAFALVSDQAAGYDTAHEQAAVAMTRLLDRLEDVYRAFWAVRAERVKSARDHICTGCPVVGTLNLKMVLHRGHAVRQTVGANPELLGPAVNVAHRLLKNSISSRLGYRAYLFLTDAAAAGLGLTGIGVEHLEEYPDVGQVRGRVIAISEDVAEAAPQVV